MKYSKIELVVSDLCEEIDSLKEQVAYWRSKFEEERDLSIKTTNESIEQSKKGIATALLFALSVRDNEDGSLSINKEDRKGLANRFL